MQAAVDDDPIMRRERNVAGDQVGLCGQVLADLTGQRQSAKAASDRDGLVAVSVDGPRGEKTDDIAPSAAHQSHPIALVKHVGEWRCR